MAGNKTSSTSFIQYSECQVCRVHHDIGTKHLYSLHHQKNLKIVLNKCLKKVMEGRKSMKTVEVHDADWEKERNVWCYFCMKEYPKHLTSNDLIIANLGLIHHLAEHEHYENVKKFLKKNRLHVKKPEKYIINKAELLSFLDTLPAAERSYLQKMKDIHNEQVSEIRDIEKQRADFLLQVASENCISNPSPETNNASGSQAKSAIKMLKKVNTPMENKIPPWLLPAHVTSYNMLSSSSSSEPVPGTSNAGPKAVIGPSMDDFLKHMKQQEEKKLNPNRVGATFDHNMVTATSWLPAFSKISNTSSRKRAAHQFKAQKRKRQNQ